MTTHSIREPHHFRFMHPKKFLMWAYLGSTTMIFAGLTSALIVSNADNVANGSWRGFAMPETFMYSTLAVLLSSAALTWAYFSAKKDKYVQLNAGLWAALLLGILFIALQLAGYSRLVDEGVYLVDNAHRLGDKPTRNVSGSFLFVITGIHALHMLAGIIALTVSLVRASLYRINSRNLLGLQLCSMFWHSLGFIWVYLFVFLSSVYN